MHTLLDRRPKESNPAYEAFKTYVAMGDGRSVRAVARRLAKSSALINRWSSKHEWVRRTAAYDDFIAKTAFEAEEAKLVKKAGVWAERMEKTREEAYQLAEELIAKARAMLKFPLADQLSQDGKTVVKPARWGFADAAKMTDVATRLKQLATGLPTERIEHSGAEGGPGGQTNIAIAELEVVVLNQMRREVESEVRGQKPEIIDATVTTGGQPSLGPTPDPQ